MVKLSPLLIISTPFLIQNAFADPLQDLCEKLRSLGLKKLSGYLAEVKNSDTPTAQHLVTTLTTPDVGPLTLFAPTDHAWDTYQFNLRDPEKRATVLSYHLIHGHFPLGLDDGKHDESFGVPPIPPPAGQVPPKQPVPISPPVGNQPHAPPPAPGPGGQPQQPDSGSGQPWIPPNPPQGGSPQQPGAGQPGVGGQPWTPPNQPTGGQPGWNGDPNGNGNQPQIPNQPGVGGNGGEWPPQGGEQWPGGQGQLPPNEGQPWQGGQSGFGGDPNSGGPPVFTSDQNEKQEEENSNSDQQQSSPQAREEPPAPNAQTQLTLAGNPPIPYDTPNHVVIGRTTLFNPRFVMLEGTNRGQVLAWSNVTGADGKNRLLHQETDCPVLKMTIWNNIVINVIPEVLHIPGSLPQLLEKHSFNAFKAMLKEATAPGYHYNMLDALDASNGWGAHGFTMFVVADEMVMHAKKIIPSIAPNDPHVMATILQNHVINGTTIYSPTFCSADYPFFTIASSGGPLTFFGNATGTFVTINHDNGALMHTARILSTELVAQNGVVHVVDQLLMSPFRDDRAAAMAYEQASIIAGQQFFPEKGPVGIPTGPPPGTSPGSGGVIVNNAAQSKLDNLLEYGGWDLTRLVLVFSVLMGIWFSTAPI